MEIAERLLNGQHDLIHKLSLMLREVGKRNLKAEEHFLNTHTTNAQNNAKICDENLIK